MGTFAPSPSTFEFVVLVGLSSSEPWSGEIGCVMCLGELARVRSVGPAGSLVVDSESRTSVVSDMLLEQSPTVGEWVLTHSGFALAIVGDAEAREALAIRGTPRDKEPG